MKAKQKARKPFFLILIVAPLKCDMFKESVYRFGDLVGQLIGTLPEIDLFQCLIHRIEHLAFAGHINVKNPDMPEHDCEGF